MEFKDKNYYLKYLNNDILDKFEEQNVSRKYFVAQYSKKDDLSFHYKEFNDIFKTFIPTFNTILNRIKDQTSISTRLITSDFRNNYQEYLKNNYMKDIYFHDKNIIANNKTAKSVMQVFNDKQIQSDKKTAIEYNDN